MKLLPTPPVLFMIFNRPELTGRVFERIRAARPQRLYIAADGPRPREDSDAKHCAAARAAVAEINWDCEVKTLFREKNLGCGSAPKQAIDWFFEHEESGIILEDDCLPAPEWFRFAGEMLDRYRDVEQVMSVSGSSFQPLGKKRELSYYCSMYANCWGWASWRRAWQHNDHEMSDWPMLRRTPWLTELGSGRTLFTRYWQRKFDIGFTHYSDIWDYQWLYSCWRRQGLSVTPFENLIQNIGTDMGATHPLRSKQLSRPLGRIRFPLNHPESLAIDTAADRNTERWRYEMSWLGELMDTLRDSGSLVRMVERIRAWIGSTRR